MKIKKSFLLSNGFIILCLIHISLFAENTFYFQLNKEKDGQLTHTFLNKLSSFFGAKNFIETGTYSGNTTAEAAKIFSTVHTVELHEGMYKAAQKRFANQSNVQVHHGDSADFIKTILPSMIDTSIFWLDAHYCGSGTAHGNSMTPIALEVKSILENNNRAHIILIDDIRGFGTREDNIEYPACNAYPLLHDLASTILTAWPTANIKLMGDTLLAYDAEIYGPIATSPILDAATQSRLRDLFSPSDFDLISAEKIIGLAQGPEREVIEWIYRDQLQYNIKEFHCYLWKALIMLNDQQPANALKECKRILDRGYTHWRIYWYAAQAAEQLGDTAAALEMLKPALEMKYQPAEKLSQQLKGEA